MKYLLTIMAVVFFVGGVIGSASYSYPLAEVALLYIAGVLCFVGFAIVHAIEGLK
ncbi:hypothetical protein MYX06_02580 [Patescibacteria group bacterium AH-259-L05]|nr:hypothetical protein [Patescibacteria group bacterium AH-259-L05]